MASDRGENLGDQFYTNRNILLEIAEECNSMVKAMPFLHGASFIDFSCGNNDFVPMLRGFAHKVALDIDLCSGAGSKRSVLSYPLDQ